MSTSLARPTIGATAPDVHLRDQDGDEWHLGSHQGHAVVLIFHRHIH